MASFRHIGGPTRSCLVGFFARSAARAVVEATTLQCAHLPNWNEEFPAGGLNSFY